MSFAFGETRVRTCRWRTSYPGAPDQVGVDNALALLKPWLESARHRKVGQNLKFDAHVLANHGIALRRHRARHAARVLRLRSARAPRPGSARGAPPGLEDHHLRRGDRQGRVAHRLRAVEIARATEYAAEDADVALSAARRALSEDRRRREAEVRLRGDRDAGVPVLFRMERNGVLIDAREARGAEPRARARRCSTIEQKAYEAAGQPFNLGSPKQIARDPVRASRGCR